MAESGKKIKIKEIPAEINNRKSHIEPAGERRKAIRAYNTPGAVWAYTFGGEPSDAKRYAERLREHLIANGLDPSRVVISDKKTITIYGSGARQNIRKGTVPETAAESPAAEEQPGIGESYEKWSPPPVAKPRRKSIPKKIEPGKVPLSLDTVSAHVYKVVFTDSSGKAAEYDFYLGSQVCVQECEEGTPVSMPASSFKAAITKAGINISTWADRESRLGRGLGFELGEKFIRIREYFPGKNIRGTSASVPLWIIDPPDMPKVFDRMLEAEDIKVIYMGHQEVENRAINSNSQFRPIGARVRGKRRRATA